MKKIIILFSPFLFLSCETSGDCGCEIYDIIIADDGTQSYSYVGIREGYCSQYDDLDGYYYYDVNCE